MDSVFANTNKKTKDLKTDYFSRRDRRKEIKSILISQNKKRERFFVGDNNLYFDGNKNNKRKKSFLDSLNYRVINNYQKFRGEKNNYLLAKYNRIVSKIEKRNEEFVNSGINFVENISPIRLWNASILTAILIGMVSMSFIYRYLGQGVSAKDDNFQQEVAGVMVSAENDKKLTPEKQEKSVEYDKKVLDNLNKKNKKYQFEASVRKLVKGYPIEKMLPYIFKQDKTTASFLVAIAKKESNWGKRVPVLNGQDCYNYWGYRQKRKRMGSGGHTCFNNRKDAVNTVGKRMHKLIFDYGKNTSKKMVVWKCGNSCATHSKKGVRKWISDVDLYLKKLNYNR